MTLYLIDGLGNQMFQYAFARQLSMEKGCKLYLNKELFRLVKASDTVREYGLLNLNLPPDVTVDKGLISKIKGVIFAKAKLPVYRRTHDVLSERYFGKNIIYALTRHVYLYQKLNPDNFSEHLEIYGQFQTAKWFEKYEKTIKHELKVATIQNKKNKLINDKIDNCESVCVHIRRGDYLNPQWEALNICNYSYYCNSMNYLKSKLKNPVFFVFSNSHEDIEWIKNNYDFSEFNVEYVDEENPDYEELRLMYSCKHFVISNSTFSWWAQYLSESTDKIVCAPSSWNKGTCVDCSNIYMDDWHVV